MFAFVAAQVTDTRHWSRDRSQARTAASGAYPDGGRFFPHPNVPAPVAPQDARQRRIRRLPHFGSSVRLALGTRVLGRSHVLRHTHTTIPVPAV